MAWKIEYVCTKCGYTADIYEGHGFMRQHIVPVSCSNCHTIQPLVVGGVIGDVAPSFNSIVGRLCLQCGSADIREWNGSTCPQCGGVMHPSGKREFWT